MTMEKYGVASVQADQREALETAKLHLAQLSAAYVKTASETSEIQRLEAQIAELEAALQQ